MKHLRTLLLILLGIVSFLATSCVHEFAVTDYSFEFAAQITYDDKEDIHRLTLTKVAGLEENEYSIAFTLDGQNNISLTDMDGRVHEGSFSERFSDISTRTYTLSRAEPGEHTLNLEIRTESFSQSIAVVYLVEDFSFAFDTAVLFDESTLTHSLELSLKDGNPSDSYTITYTIDNKEPRKTYQETFSDILVRSYPLPAAEPGEHTVNLQISTGRHQMTEEISYSVTDYSFKVQADIEKTAESRRTALAKRKEILLGTNQYPNFSELSEGKYPKDAACGCGCHSEEKQSITIATKRLAEDFEQLRLQTEESGRRPKAFMLTIGNLAMRQARAQFSCNFLATAGYEVIDNLGFKSVDEGVKAALEANADIVVICSSDDEYAEYAIPAYNAIGDKAIFIVAGAPACMPELQQAGIENFIHVRVNVLDTLRDLNKKLGI